MQDRGPAAYIAEFIGTLDARLLHRLVVSLYGPAPPRATPNPFIDWSVIGLVHVFVLFVLIQTLAVVSGAHFNPAVTVAMTALRQIKAADAGIYIVAQLAGAVAGALLVKADPRRRGRGENYGAVRSPTASTARSSRASAVEVIGTFFLRVGDHRRGGEPARDRGLGGLRDRRRAGHGCDGARRRSPAPASTRRAASARRSSPASGAAPATSCSPTCSAPIVGALVAARPSTSGCSSRRGRRVPAGVEPVG